MWKHHGMHLICHIRKGTAEIASRDTLPTCQSHVTHMNASTWHTHTRARVRHGTHIKEPHRIKELDTIKEPHRIKDSDEGIHLHATQELPHEVGWCVAVWCSVLRVAQCVAVCCSVDTLPKSFLMKLASALPCGAVCWSALQCVAALTQYPPPKVTARIWLSRVTHTHTHTHMNASWHTFQKKKFDRGLLIMYVYIYI